MSWDLDTPNIPFKKPKLLANLEELAPSQREAMDPVEVKEHIRDVANSLAKAYKETKKGNYEGCVLIVNSALSETGSSLGGKMGTTMVALSGKAAEHACREFFPK